MATPRWALLCAALLACPGTAAGRPRPARDLPSIVEASRSPDGRFAVTAEELRLGSSPQPKNRLVDTVRRRSLAVLPGEGTPRSAPNHSIIPRWSSDGSLLVWYVEGKYGSMVLLVIRMQGTRALVTDVREQAVATVLRAIRQARPRGWRAARRVGRGNGRWFRDGLAIDVYPDFIDDEHARPGLPLRFTIWFTANPKGDDEFTHDAWIEGRTDGVVDAAGTVTVGKVAFVPRPWETVEDRWREPHLPGWMR